MRKTVCLILIFSVFLSLFTFSGEAKDYSYEEMADFLNSLDILHGDASMGGDYNFYGSLTRAQFTKLAVASSEYRSSVAIKTNTSPFYDVKRDHWAAGYIKSANNNKLISGYPDSTFRPENGIILEEAVTVVLKLLGYQNSDFGGEWPNGQLSIAKNTGLLDNVTVNQGEYMKRIDAIALLYNALTGDTKQGTEYLSKLGYSLQKNITLVASYLQDTTLDTDEVVTSIGNYTVKDGFDFDKIGMRGDALVKNNKEIAGFFTEGQNKKTYIITGVLGTTIVVNDKGTSKSFPISDETVAYYNSSKTTYASLANRVSAGDIFSVISDDTGRVKYVTATSQRMEGPITVASSSFLSDLKMNENEVTVIKSGGTASVSDVKVNDIIYYSKNLNTVWVYAERRTGIYEEAIPNQEFPS
ncbi:MAG: S-layer homology domain-containing protein, partial [Clostridia bacterium]|nr:S-layer homology domain-containing protein [Clostridia bacterium]